MNTTDISTFDDLLAAARAQSEPQRLLLVFAAAELGADATPDQRAAFEAGHGGELAPMMCVDKAPHEIADFATLCAEASQAGPHWAIVFAAALAGAPGQRLDSAAAKQPLQRMVDGVRSGALSGMVAFDRRGQAVSLG